MRALKSMPAIALVFQASGCSAAVCCAPCCRYLGVVLDQGLCVLDPCFCFCFGGGGCIRRGGRAGGRGVWLGASFSQGPPMVPAEGVQKNFTLKSSWHQRRQSKILAVGVKNWKGRGGGYPPSSYGVLPF